ncbi:MAG: hypothetical protein FWH41_07635 [Treponema sp.]|nr:hypothetical protein [Treponema sp.]MCL2139386.1 hypothetical protein [Treponema sp.]
MKKKPRFFCDNCNCEVERNAKSCPKCGRFFASIHCPSCGFNGDDKSFANGCPSCGYSSPPPFDPKKNKPLARTVPSGKLPLWVYVFSVCALITVIFLLVYMI